MRENFVWQYLFDGIIEAMSIFFSFLSFFHFVCRCDDKIFSLIEVPSLCVSVSWISPSLLNINNNRISNFNFGVIIGKQSASNQFRFQTKSFATFFFEIECNQSFGMQKRALGEIFLFKMSIFSCDFFFALNKMEFIIKCNFCQIWLGSGLMKRNQIIIRHTKVSRHHQLYYLSIDNSLIIRDIYIAIPIYSIYYHLL